MSELIRSKTGKMTGMILGGVLFLIILSIFIGRYSMFDNNVNLGPVLLNRVYQGFPLNN